jgi:hypothetical protein
METRLKPSSLKKSEMCVNIHALSAWLLLSSASD